MKPAFPAFNLSYPVWDLDVLGDFFIYDDSYRGDEAFFKKFYLYQDFVDCKGSVFRIVGKKEVERKKCLFRFRKVKIQFQEVGEKLTLDEFKGILKQRVESLDSDVAKKEINSIIKTSSTIRALIRGF